MPVPFSTYRLQLHGFSSGFVAATEVIDYLAQLGVGAVYLSPTLAAAAGSTHGYDIVDHARIDPALGTEADMVRFAEAVRDHAMGLVLDVVPNHMCITSADNIWWRDVLENGPSSPYSTYFDIDWSPPKSDLHDRVLLPILGDQYGNVLERGEITIRHEGDSFVAAYFDVRLPIAPRTWGHVLEPAIELLKQSQGEASPLLLELESILTAVEHLPARTETERAKVRERRREKEIAKQRLTALLADPVAKQAIDAAIAELNADVDHVEALLADQGYRPSHWRVAADEINYRRFFDINELAAIRIEQPAVLRAVHEVALRMIKQKLATGLRIDHIDGLLSPYQYLVDLERALRQATADAGIDPQAAPCYLVVEKILADGERLPERWPIHGTTGYEVGTAITRLLVDQVGLDKLSDVYRSFTGNRTPRADIVYDSKELVLQSAMSAELTVLARKLDDISEQHRSTRDFTLNSLQHALSELIACFAVYRTYIDPAESISPTDRRQIEAAIAEARRRNPATSASIYDFLRQLLLLEDPPNIDSAQIAARRDFVLRFQQLTSPVMAKGLEDTAFYRHVPLVALNEVGGGAKLAAMTIDAFHAECTDRARRSPASMSATATHDSKRGEDLRARLCVLSEVPAAWRRTLARVAQLAPATHEPDANEEYLLYQTLLGAWPPGTDQPTPELVSRIQAYMQKAMKEAKVNTSWVNPNDERDRAVDRYIAVVLDHTICAPLLAELATLRTRIELPGYCNALTQLVLKLGVPGVPDIYQGCELWDHNLVDPDNRRPVDYELRKRRLAELRREAEVDPAALVDRLFAAPADGAIKMYVLHRGLMLRRAHKDVFLHGGFTPLATTGPHRDRAIAFERTHGGKRIVIACGRHFLKVNESGGAPVGACWRDTAIELTADATLRDAFTGRRIESKGKTLGLDQVFAHLPVAMLEVP